MGRALDPLDLFCVSTERHLALCPVLRTFLTRWSALHDDDAGFRARCAQLVELVTAAQATAEHRATRLFMVLDWALRRTTATWLALAGLDVQATAWSRRAPLGSWEDLTALAPYLAESRARASVHGLQAERGRIVDEAQLTRAVALVGKATGWHAAWAAMHAASLEGRGAAVNAAWFDAWCAVADAVRCVALRDREAVERGISEVRQSGLDLLVEMATLRGAAPQRPHTVVPHRPVKGPLTSRRARIALAEVRVHGSAHASPTRRVARIVLD